MVSGKVMDSVLHRELLKNLEDLEYKANDTNNEIALEMTVTYVGFSKTVQYNISKIQEMVLAIEGQEGIACIELDPENWFAKHSLEMQDVINTEGEKRKHEKSAMHFNILSIELETFAALEKDLLLRVGNHMIVVGQESKVHLKLNLETENNGDIYVFGNRSVVSIDASAAHDASEDITIIGDDCHVNIQMQIGVDNGSDILVIGNHSKVNMRGKIRSHKGSERIILGEYAELNYKAMRGVYHGDDTILIGNRGKLSIKGHSNTHRGDTVWIVGDDMQFAVHDKNKEMVGNEGCFIGQEITFHSLVHFKIPTLKARTELIHAYVQDVLMHANQVIRQKKHQ